MHFNPKLQHQLDHAKAFASSGFEITTDPKQEADIHVVSGPYYAKPYWLNHPRVLEIDRAYWGDPDYISIGWRNPDGTRRFATGDADRTTPEMRDWKAPWPQFGELSCLILADYGQDVGDIAAQAKERFVQVEVRHHPADIQRGKFDNIPLDMQVTWYDCVIGTSGTAIFEAIIRGIPTICLDPKNPCAPVCADSIDAPMFRGDRSDWLKSMAYKQWSLDEIASGEAWAYLKSVI